MCSIFFSYKVASYNAIFLFVFFLSFVSVDLLQFIQGWERGYRQYRFLSMTEGIGLISVPSSCSIL